jgi:hypothetical protein
MNPRRIALVVLAALGVCLTAPSAALAAEFPTGTFTASLDGEEWTVKFEKDKYFVIFGGETVVEGKLKVEKDVVTFTDEKGKFAEKGDLQTGKYNWKFEDKKLYFKKIEDKADGRAAALSVPWTMK